MDTLLSGDLGRTPAASLGMQQAEGCRTQPNIVQGTGRREQNRLTSQPERCWGVLAGLGPGHTLEIQ